MRAQTHRKLDGCRLLLLAACGTGGEFGAKPASPGPSTSAKAPVESSGTWHGSSNRDLVVDRPSEIKVATFEGTTAVVTEIKGPATDCPDARYEIHVLENRNLQYLALEDTCAKRAIALNVSIWAPVP